MTPPFRLLFVSVVVLVVGAIIGGELFRPARAAVNPVEVGKVLWGRDFDVGQAESRASGKPMLVLFQEVPGCKGCQKFGREVLSDPGIVTAIERNFIPVLVCNNHPGKDAELTKRFNEPSWNYQVVRFLTADGRDLIPREDQVWTVTALSARMTSALNAAKRPVPPELRAAQTAAPNSSASLR